MSESPAQRSDLPAGWPPAGQPGEVRWLSDTGPWERKARWVEGLADSDAMHFHGVWTRGAWVDQGAAGLCEALMRRGVRPLLSCSGLTRDYRFASLKAKVRRTLGLLPLPYEMSAHDDTGAYDNTEATAMLSAECHSLTEAEALAQLAKEAGWVAEASPPSDEWPYPSAALRVSTRQHGTRGDEEIAACWKRLLALVVRWKSEGEPLPSKSMRRRFWPGAGEKGLGVQRVRWENPPGGGAPEIWIQHRRPPVDRWVYKGARALIVYVLPVLTALLGVAFFSGPPVRISGLYQGLLLLGPLIIGPALAVWLIWKPRATVLLTRGQLRTVQIHKMPAESWWGRAAGAWRVRYEKENGKRVSLRTDSPEPFRTALEMEADDRFEDS